MMKTTVLFYFALLCCLSCQTVRKQHQTTQQLDSRQEQRTTTIKKEQQAEKQGHTTDLIAHQAQQMERITLKFDTSKPINSQTNQHPIREQITQRMVTQQGVKQTSKDTLWMQKEVEKRTLLENQVTQHNLAIENEELQKKSLPIWSLFLWAVVIGCVILWRKFGS